MRIERINRYQDPRFSQKVLNQHGAFLVDDRPYEVEIISDFEALVRAVEADTDECLFAFAEEARRRGVAAPEELILLPHSEYAEKWNRFCDDFFASRKE